MSTSYHRQLLEWWQKRYKGGRRHARVDDIICALLPKARWHHPRGEFCGFISFARAFQIALIQLPPSTMLF